MRRLFRAGRAAAAAGVLTIATTVALASPALANTTTKVTNPIDGRDRCPGAFQQLQTSAAYNSIYFYTGNGGSCSANFRQFLRVTDSSGNITYQTPLTTQDNYYGVGQDANYDNPGGSIQLWSGILPKNNPSAHWNTWYVTEIFADGQVRIHQESSGD